MDEPKIFADLEIQSVDGDPSCYSVKLDGVEISKYVKNLDLHIAAGGFATLTLGVNTEKISINSRCIWNIPEPYAGLLAEKKIVSPYIGGQA